MKNLDMKSVIIGILSCACMFLIMGQTNSISDKIVTKELLVKSTDGTEIRIGGDFGGINVNKDEGLFTHISSDGIIIRSSDYKFSSLQSQSLGIFDGESIFASINPNRIEVFREKGHSAIESHIIKVTDGLENITTLKSNSLNIIEYPRYSDENRLDIDTKEIKFIKSNSPVVEISSVGEVGFSTYSKFKTSGQNKYARAFFGGNSPDSDNSSGIISLFNSQYFKEPVAMLWGDNFGGNFALNDKNGKLKFLK